MTLDTPKARPSRRTVLRGAAAALGVATGSGAIRGFPTIWAQNIKDVVLNHAGPPVTAIPAIAEQATKDLGFTVHMQASENADLLNRFLSQTLEFGGRPPTLRPLIPSITAPPPTRAFPGIPTPPPSPSA